MYHVRSDVAKRTEVELQYEEDSKNVFKNLSVNGWRV